MDVSVTVGSEAFSNQPHARASQKSGSRSPCELVVGRVPGGLFLPRVRPRCKHSITSRCNVIVDTGYTLVDGRWLSG